MNKLKQAFTLVELIITILVLVILWTISFNTFFWYSKIARDTRRITDVQNIKKSLEIYQINSWVYPKPDHWKKIKYLHASVRNQWTIWNWVYINLSKNLLKKPLDPLTQTEYTYSLLNTWKEYELWLIRETNNVLWVSDIYFTNQVYASNIKAYVTWNYNWEVAKVSTGAIDYILAVPSIINWNINVLDYLEVVKQKTLVYNWYNNLPYTYNDNPIIKNNQ